MHRSLLLSMLPCLLVTFLSGCQKAPPERPVATSAETVDSMAWELATDRWKELVENAKARIPEAEAARKKISGGKNTITVEFVNDGFPAEAEMPHHPDLPAKVVIAQVDIKVQEKLGDQDSRQFDYSIRYIWNLDRWDFFEGTSVLTKCTLPESDSPANKVGRMLRLETADRDDNLVSLFGPPLSEKAKASLGIEAKPPTSKKPGA